MGIRSHRRRICFRALHTSRVATQNDAALESIDALVLPATPFAATRIDESDPVALSKGNLTRFTRMFNLTGNPAIVLPCGRTTDGLPIGLQIVGPHWQEEKIFAHRYGVRGAAVSLELSIADC